MILANLKRFCQKGSDLLFTSFFKRYKKLFVFLSVISFLVSFSVNVFAEDTPSLYSSGYSYNDDHIYTGNTDISVSFGVSVPDSDDYINLSISLNPSISYDMDSVDGIIYTDDIIIEPSIDVVQINHSFSNFEYSDNYFISGIVSDHSYFSSNFTINCYSENSNLFVDFMKVSARDFYIYLDPSDEFTDPYYDDLFAESFLYLNPQSFYDGAEGTIYYCLAGEEDSANNRQVYNYSYTSDETTSDTFLTLPFDQSFSGTYSEPTLIYVEYFVLYIPFDQSSFYSLDSLETLGTYVNYNMDYRNIDISSYEEPISPVNPGIFRDYTGWIGTAVGGFLNLELVDGFSLGGILMVIIAFMITMWFLKVFAGG